MRRTFMAILGCSLAGLLTTSASVQVEGWYRMGEDGLGTGNEPKDSSGNGRDFVNADANSWSSVATSTTTPPPASTKYYVFPGDLTGFSDVGWDPPENNVGVECWAKSSDLEFITGTTAGKVVFGTGHNQNGIGILYDDFGAGFVGVLGNVDYVGIPYQPATTNEWVHLAVVRDNGVSTFYVNGVARTPTRTSAPVDSTIPFMAYGGSLGNFAGAIDEARIFTFKPGEFYPNDLLFYQSTNTLPYVTTFKGALDGFLIRVQDKTTTANASTIAVKLDDAAVTPTVNQAGGLTSISYASPSYLASGSAHTVNLVFADSAGVSQTNDLSFTVAPYVSVPADDVMPPGVVDTTKPGFRIRTYQTDGTLVSGQQPNSLAWTEDQLIGLHGANIADTTGADATGFVDFPGVINLSIEAGTGTDRGNFPNDQLVPGLPGTTQSTGNASFEAVTFLQFAAAGVYQMGVNSDDGFKVTTGKNPRDRFAVVLGQFDGGRGAADTIFTFTIPQAGIYPFRLLWENGNGELTGNQANCEWFTVLADGTKALVNDAQSPVKAYRVGPLPPFVSRLVPGMAQIGVLPNSDVEVDVTDGSTTVNQGSILIGLNGGALTTPTTVNKNGSVTTAKLTPPSPFVVSSVNTAQVAWADSGSYAVTNSWQFTVLDATLPPDLRTPLGSGDKTKPGFRVHTWQVDTFTANGATAQGIVNEVPVGNSLLAGVWGPNIADLTLANNGEFTVPSVVNWNRDAGLGTDIGFFQAPDFTDEPIPGIPGTLGGYENLASEVLTYVEFPTSGVYTMGVNSDDGFRVTAAEQASPGAGTVRVTAPASKTGNYLALATYSANGGLFGGPWPRTPIIRPLVASNDGTTGIDTTNANVGDSYMFCINPLVNASDVAGNIAVVKRGGGIPFAQKAKFCQDAGALAVIFVDRSDLAGQKPWGMGGSDGSVTIPCIMVNWDVWAAIGDAVTTNATTTQITVSLTDDASPMLGQYDGGRGAGTPTLFSFYVPQAGVYPLRLMYEQGQGGANCEWFSVDDQGNYVLVNDTANSKSLKAYRARTVQPAPTIGITKTAGNVVITYTGNLQAAEAITGPWSNVAGSSPQTIPTTGTQKFYRAQQ